MSKSAVLGTMKRAITKVSAVRNGCGIPDGVSDVLTYV
jgi:hypothetical protein